MTRIIHQVNIVSSPLVSRRVGIYLLSPTSSMARVFELSVPDKQQRESANAMKPKALYVSEDLRAEYNFDYSKAVRGKYYKRILKQLDTTKKADLSLTLLATTSPSAA